MVGRAAASAGRTHLSTALIAAAIGVTAFSLHFAQAFTGRLELRRPTGTYGREAYATGSSAWPREATDAAANTTNIPAAPARIASLYWSLDEYAYSVASPEKVVGVSETASLPKVSNITRLVDQYRPVVANNAEVVLKLGPDIVLGTSDGGSELPEILRQAGVPTFQAFTNFRTLDEVAETILLTGYLTGEDARAQRAHREFQEAIARAKARKPAGARAPRVLGLGGRYSYGDETLFHDIVRVLGGVNVGAENGLHGYDAISSETILRADPEWIVTGGVREKQEEVRARIVNDPAIALTQAVRNGHVIVLDNNVFLPMSPYTALLLDSLGNALYGKPQR